MPGTKRSTELGQLKCACASVKPGMSVAPAPSTTTALSRGKDAPGARETASIRLPLTSTSATNGAAPLPSKTRVLTKRIMQSPYAPASCEPGMRRLRAPMAATASRRFAQTWLLELGFKCNAHLPQRVHRLSARNSADGTILHLGTDSWRDKRWTAEQRHRLVIVADVAREYRRAPRVRGRLHAYAKPRVPIARIDET